MGTLSSPSAVLVFSVTSATSCSDLPQLCGPQINSADTRSPPGKLFPPARNWPSVVDATDRRADLKRPDRSRPSSIFRRFGFSIETGFLRVETSPDIVATGASTCTVASQRLNRMSGSKASLIRHINSTAAVRGAEVFNWLRAPLPRKISNDPPNR